MTTMVEAELKNIMINVWQTLPDDASDEAEKLVIESLKNTAGDDLRNAIGLNVTQRLLNIHNGIYIKVKIPSGPVTPSDLSSFAKKYDISYFKYVQSRTYTGQVQSWTDLDVLYSTKNLKCGQSRAIITPVYKFMKCPARLRTVFDGKQDYSDAKTIEKETARKMKKPEEKAIVTAEQVLAQEAKKSVAKEKVPDSKPKVEVKAVQNKTECVNKNKTVVASKTTVESKSTDIKPTPTKASHTIIKGILKSKQDEITTETKPNKVEPTLTAVKAAMTTNTPKKDISTPKPNMTKKLVDVKTEQVETTKAPTKESAKPDTTEKHIVKQKANEKNNPNDNATKQQPTNTKVPLKPVAKEFMEPVNTDPKELVKTAARDPSKTVSKKFVELVAKEPVNIVAKEAAKTVAREPAKTLAQELAKAVSKKSIETVVMTKDPKEEIAKAKLTAVKKTETKKATTKVLPTITAAKIAPKTPVESPNKRIKVDKIKSSDFDELNDHDILAMLSSGIVLDECSGSDID